MIVKISLNSANPIVLPKNYNHILQSFFYRNMDSELSRFLHDIGFPHGKRRFKLFTFSKIIGKMISKERGRVVFEPRVRLYFASPLMDIVSSSVKTFLKRENLFIGKNRLELESVELLKPQVKEEASVRCLSPITVYRTPEGGRRKEFLSPWQDEFYDLIKKNLIKKYELIYGRSYEGELEIKPLKISQRYRKKIVYRGSLIVAWEGYYIIKGSEDMVRLALESGLGVKNSQGFGMVEVVEGAKGD